jgi:hypothetical protein
VFNRAMPNIMQTPLPTRHSRLCQYNLQLEYQLS